MIIEKIAIERTFNCGNYESLRLGCEASALQGENIASAYYRLNMSLELTAKEMINQIWNKRKQQENITEKKKNEL